MSKQATFTANALRPYPSRFADPLLLVCRKCEKRFKTSSSHPLKLRKLFKRLQHEDPETQPPHILSTGCMKLCPKDGITVCPQSQLANLEASPSLYILRTKRDARAFYYAQNRLPDSKRANLIEPQP